MSSPDPPHRTESPQDARALEFVTRLGAALLAASAPVPTVRRQLSEVSSRYGLSSEYLVLPHGIMAVGSPDNSTSLAVTDPTAYRLDQTELLFALVSEALEGNLDASAGLRRLESIRTVRRASGSVARFSGYVLMTVGLALRLNPVWRDFAVCAVLGIVVAALILATSRLRMLKSLVPTLAAVVVGVPVFLLVDQGAVSAPVQILVPLLASFIPGMLLTIGALELSTGETQAGAARIIAGVHQLVLLAFGLVLAASLAGLTAATVPMPPAGPEIGPWAPVVGVGVYAIGVGLAFSSPRGSLPGLAVVVYAAWLGQLLGDALLGGYLSGFIGAFLAVLVAAVVHRRFAGPPPLLTVSPVFRILAPGGLGLVGVTKIAVGSAAGLEVGAVLFLFIAVAMGIVAGNATDLYLRNRFTWW